MSSTSSRLFDVVIFGASGFTGKYVVYELLLKGRKDLSIAIAGRSKEKLSEVLTEAKKRAPGRQLDTLVADVNDATSMAAMCKKARLLLNCVGPYRFFGEQVVKACVSEGTDYLDITGEPEFIERMQLNYHAQAEAKGLLIVSACGFDSIPNDMGTLFTISSFPDGVTPSAIDSFACVNSGSAGMHGHYTTFECAVHGFGSQKNLAKIRKSRPHVKIPVIGKKAVKHSGPFFEKEVGKYCLPFPGADASIVKRSQEYFVGKGELTKWKPVQFSAYFGLPSLFWTIIVVIIGIIFSTLAKYSFGRKLLLNNPKIFTLGRFSHDGPSEEEMRQTSFSIRFVGKGYTSKANPATDKPDFKIVTEVSGPEPGYIATPLAIVQAAIVVLEQKSSLPSGVLTTAAAFSKTDLIQKLDAAGLKFKVISAANK